MLCRYTLKNISNRECRNQEGRHSTAYQAAKIQHKCKNNKNLKMNTKREVKFSNVQTFHRKEKSIYKHSQTNCQKQKFKKKSWSQF